MDQTAALRSLGGQRVWSLMVSLFGDLARGPGDVIEGPTLTTIMEGLDIKPEATRVALHRLRKDGWLRSEKSGRISRHSLTPKGRTESAAASPRIYADPDGGPEHWQIAVLPGSEVSQTQHLSLLGFTALTTRLYLGPYPADLPPEILSLRGEHVPTWLIDEAQPTTLVPAYRALLDTLQGLQSALIQSPPQNAVQIAVLRCLIVHNWRKLVLKHPQLPRALVDLAGPMHHCQRLVWDLLRQYPAPKIRDLDKHPDGA